MQENKHPSEIVQDAIASITMISREAIRAINGLAVEATTAPVMGEYADKVFGSGQNSAQEPSASDPTDANAALAATGDGSVNEKEQQPQPSDSEKTGEATGDQEGSEQPAGSVLANMSPNDCVRFMQGQTGGAPAANAAPTPNEIISGAGAPAPTDAVPAENAIGEQVETGQAQE